MSLGQAEADANQPVGEQPSEHPARMPLKPASFDWLGQLWAYHPIIHLTAVLFVQAPDLML